MKKTLILVGAGPGLGNHVAQKFGRQDFRVVLLARSESALQQYEAEFSKEGMEVSTQVVDASKPETLTAAFDRVKAQFGTPDVLVYNAASLGADQPGSITSDVLMHHYQVDVASAYHCVQQVVSDEFGQKNGAILLTGGGLGLHPHAAYTPLSMGKAALRAMAFLLHADLQPRGIFVGTVTVAGPIAPGTSLAPELLADKFWDLYTQRQDCEVVCH